MADPDALMAALEAAGLDAGAAVWAAPPDDGAQPPPEGPWVIVPFGAQMVVGGMGRGKFAAYESVWTEADAIRLAVSLSSAPLPVRSNSLTSPELDRGRGTAAGIQARTRGRSGAAGAAEIRPGDLLDLFGPETGHHAYALGSPFPERSQPPSDVGAPYYTFEVSEALPPTVLEGVAAPWFGQPGGGAMIVFDRPIRWYVDRGFIAVLHPSAAVPRS